MPWRSWAAEGLRLLDRNEEARALADEELALARRWGDPHAIGASLRVLGLVEGGEAGIGLLREAVELLAGSQARLEHAHALVDLGAALRRANQRTEARERLREGVDLARRVGAFGLAERANEEIAATGARPRKVLQTGLDALTASERRVAQLAADGMSNKEIAQTLFVTIKTVEVHLSHAYRKLEISSRAQLDKALLTPAPSPAPRFRLIARRPPSGRGRRFGASLGSPPMRIGSAGTQYSAVEMNERAVGTFTASCDGVVEGRLELMRGGTSITIRGAEIEGSVAPRSAAPPRGPESGVAGC